MWDLPGSGIEPMSPASAGEFLTAEPPGKPHSVLFPESAQPLPGRDCTSGSLGSHPKAPQWLLLLLLSHFSHVRLLATPWTAALPGSSVHGIFQARVLEWGAVAFSATVAEILLFWGHTPCAESDPYCQARGLLGGVVMGGWGAAWEGPQPFGISSF